MSKHQDSDPAALLDGLEQWLGELAARKLAEPAALGAAQAVLAQSRGERLDLPEDPLLVVMLCGPTAVGKSTLINTIAGAEIARPGLGATTAAALIYLHAQDDAARLFEYGETVGRLAQRPHTVVRHERPELRHKVLIDTPDIDSVIRDHRAGSTPSARRRRTAGSARAASVRSRSQSCSSSGTATIARMLDPRRYG